MAALRPAGHDRRFMHTTMIDVHIPAEMSQKSIGSMLRQQLLDVLCDLQQRNRIQTVVGKVAERHRSHTQKPARFSCSGTPRSDLRGRLLLIGHVRAGGNPVCYKPNGHSHARLGEPGDGTTTTQHLVVGMRRNHEGGTWTQFNRLNPA